MTMNTYVVTPKVKELTGSKKRSFYFEPANTVTPRGGWSGGSRSCYTAIEWRTGKPYAFHIGDQWSIQAKQQVLPAGVILIETGTFCGKPATPRIYCNPTETDEVAQWLGIAILI